MSKVERINYGPASSDMTKVTDVDGNFKKMKSALSKMEVQLGAQGLKIDAVRPAAEKAMEGKLATFESRLGTAQATAGKKAAENLSALEARLDAVAASLQTEWKKESKHLSEKLAHAEASQETLQAKLTVVESALGHLKEHATAWKKAPQTDASVVDRPKLDAHQGETIALLQHQVARLTEDNAARASQAELMQSKMDAVMARIMSLESTHSSHPALPSRIDSPAIGGDALVGTVALLEAKVEGIQARLDSKKPLDISAPPSECNRGNADLSELSSRLERVEDMTRAATTALAAVETHALELDTKVQAIVSRGLDAGLSSDPLADHSALTGSVSAAITDARPSTTAAADISKDLSAVIQELQQRLLVLESAAPQPAPPQPTSPLSQELSTASPAAATFPDEAIQQLETRVKSLEVEAEARLTARLTVEPLDVSVFQVQLTALSEQVRALDQQLASGLPPPSEGVSQPDASTPTPTTDLSSRIDALGGELHDRVSELQDKTGQLLQALVQRVQALEVKGPTGPSDGGGTPSVELTERSSPAPVASDSDQRVETCILQIKELRERLMATEGSLESLAVQSSASVPDTKPWEGELTQLSTQVSHLQERLAAADGRLESISVHKSAPIPDSQQLEVELIQLSTQMQDLRVRIKEMSAVPPGVQPDVFNQRLQEVQEEGIARLQEMHDMITPVLQLLVKRVKALESAESPAASSTGELVSMQQKVLELSGVVSVLPGRIEEVDENFSGKLATMQGKVSNVMQLIVQRVKALEASLGKQLKETDRQ